MIDSIHPYSVGALLYCPALNEKVADSVLGSHFGSKYSLALCLEDTIADDAVDQALNQLELTFRKLCLGKSLPKIFVRVRNPEQIPIVFQRIEPYLGVFSGFIFPKYSLDQADRYNAEFKQVLSRSRTQFYMMPILESGDIVSPGTRMQVLLALKEKIDAMKPHVLNVRVGGNDFSNAFGARRHVDETIYDILPIAQILGDILAVFSREYIVSGPVWEYYAGADGRWKTGLEAELKKDLLNGFVGKTVIHPNQIPVVTEALKVDPKDYADATQILSWKYGKGLMVSGSESKERLNEEKAHQNWAKKISALAAAYGVREK